MSRFILLVIGAYLLYVAFNPEMFTEGEWFWGLGLAVIGWIMLSKKILENVGGTLMIIGVVSTAISFIGVRYSTEVRTVAFIGFGVGVLWLLWLLVRWRNRRMRHARQRTPEERQQFQTQTPEP